jgi:hypothetical protein
LGFLLERPSMTAVLFNSSALIERRYRKLNGSPALSAGLPVAGEFSQGQLHTHARSDVPRTSMDSYYGFRVSVGAAAGGGAPGIAIGGRTGNGGFPGAAFGADGAGAAGLSELNSRVASEAQKLVLY